MNFLWIRACKRNYVKMNNRLHRQDTPQIKYWVKSGNFGHQVNSDSDVCLLHTLITRIKNKLTKQTVKILMRRLIRSRLIWISTVCKRMSEFT